MDLAFADPKHEKLLNDYEALSRRYNKKKGIDSATAILSAINVLKAAPTLAEVPRGYRPHPLRGSYKGCFAVDVDRVNRVIFRPNQEKDPTYRIDNFKSIKSMLILAIFEDYH
jgi:mRNA-degrading endonuclease YafQ of YafQ-DinJ toxin-antitoxin module